MLRSSIKNKIIAAIILVIFVFICAYTAFWFHRVNGALTREFNLQIDTALKLSAAPVAKALWEFDFERAASTLDGLRELPAYRFAVVETSGEIFVKESATGAWPAEWDALLADLTEDGANPGRRVFGEMLILVERLDSGGAEVGVLKLGFSRGDLLAERASALVRSAAYGLGLTFVMALVLATWLSRLIGPIDALAGAVRRISAGDLSDGSVATSRSDEIGALAHAVDLLRASYLEARTDTLTGLPNRRAFDDHLEALTGDGDYALLLIDLNDFKPINDSFGHHAGDVVLREVGARLRRRAGEAATAFRLGGDEFALVDATVRDAERARALGVEAVEDVRQAIHFNGEQLHVGVSVGVSLASTVVGGRPSDVLSAADTAMYMAKQRATTPVVVFENSVKHRRFGVRDRRQLEGALTRGEIAPWLQPQICLRTERLVGFEALARWRHPQRGLLSPAVFLPMVEDLQLQRAFDIAMARRVLEFIRETIESGAEPHRVAVNIAEPTLARQEGVEQLLWLLDEYCSCREYLTLEITEDVFVARSVEAIRRALEKLFNAGVRISMDDFGTGYGSFRHLQEWDFHELKIDRSFVSKIGEDRSSEIIIKGFISISEGLGAEIVAEGVESDAQMDFLRRNGCHFGQGHFFGRPEPIELDTVHAIRG